ncbi:MAG TPA: hypothetical protein VF601_17345 [Beijerinckiaceae bacterium]
MKFTTHFLHAARPGTVPKSVPVSGDYPSIAHAKKEAVAMATNDPNFKNWCVALEIEDEHGTVVAEWRNDQSTR